MAGVGIQGCLSMDTFTQVAEAGISSPQFTALCSWLVSELRALCPLEEDVNPTRGPADAETFQIEVSGLLGELRCPYSSLTTGDVTARLSTPDRCLQLLYFLSSELLAARLQARKRPRSPPEQDNRAGEVVSELQHICQALGMPELDPGCPIRQAMTDIEAKEALEGIHKALLTEYQCRRHMMITRFNVTVESFHWSERAKDCSAAMSKAFRPLRQSLLADSQVTLPHLLAAREDFSRVVKTSSGASRDKTCCAINKVLMTGSVPDRGGRPNEIEPPMPMWEKRRGGGGGSHQRWGKQGKKKK